MNQYMLTSAPQCELYEARIVRISPFQAHRMRMSGFKLSFLGRN